MGHTLVDNFFTLWGLLGAGQVLEMVLGYPVRALVLVVGLLGFFMAVGRCITVSSPLPLLFFFLINVGVFLFFASFASLSSTEVRSWAEQVGAKVDPDVQAALAKVPIQTSTTSFGLTLSVRAIGGIVRGVVELLNADFIAAPMAITRAVVTGMTFDIGDPALRKKADTFKLECYTPAVQLYVDRLNAQSALTKNNLAPSTLPRGGAMTVRTIPTARGCACSSTRPLRSVGAAATPLLSSLVHARPNCAPPPHHMPLCCPDRSTSRSSPLHPS